MPLTTEITFLPMEAVGEGEGFDLSFTRELGDLGGGYTYFRDGDLLIAKITPSFENGKGGIATGLVNALGFGSTELHVLRPVRGVRTRWLYYVSRSAPFIGELSASMQGVAGQQRVPEEVLKDYVIPIPPLPLQDRLIAVLDRETSRIDSLIAKKKRQLSLLEEKCQATIGRCVTKGLDPKARMKDSQRDWMGLIPSHWETRKIKHVARVDSGHTPRKDVPDYWVDCHIPWVTPRDYDHLRANDTIDDTVQHINELGMANSTAHLLPAGVVLFSRDATVGLTAITTREMAVSQSFIAWVCGPKILPKYLLLVVHAMRPELHRLTLGSTIGHIGMPEARELETPLPPIDEQRSIVAFVDPQRESISRLSQMTRKSVDLLRERRQSLITAAVNGQLDNSVSSWETPITA